MKTRVIRVLTFEGCPHADSAKAAVRAAIAMSGGEVDVREMDLLDPATPPEFRGYPSPTILVGMDEVSPRAGGMSGVGCRVSGAPSVEEILEAIRAASDQGP